MNTKKNSFEAYLFLLPSFIFFSVFIVYPITFILQTSFYKWDGFSPEKVFLGLGNYIKIIDSGYLPVVLKNTLLFGIIAIVVQCFLGMIFAECLREKVILSKFFKSIIFLPVVLTPVVIGYVFSNILETNYGLLNSILRSIGLSSLAQDWLGNPKIAIYTIIAVNIWQWTGFSMFLYISGMTSISPELYEAASLDGVNETRRFFMITFPLLKGTHFTLTILGAIGALKVFDIIWVLTGGGPGVASSSFSTLILKESFIAFNQGVASALSVILMFLALVITVVQLKLYNKSL